MRAQLRIERLNVRYGHVNALSELSVEVAPGELLAIVGANGAGKSSMLKAIAGLAPASGRLTFEGRDIARLAPAQRVEAGIALVPEGRRILLGMTVHENLLLGGWVRGEPSRSGLEAIYARFPNLAKRRDMAASVLSGGEQQILAIGRALMSQPKLLLLDEPSLGLSPLLTTAIFQLVRELNRQGTSIVLVEQNIHQALRIAHRACVLELGRVVAEGEPRALMHSPVLREAYLGKA